jgi:hypothetical protein
MLSLSRPALVAVPLLAVPLLAVGTIVTMTVPADFDTVSTVTLAVCHLTLVPVIVAAVTVLGPRPVPRPG